MNNVGLDDFVPHITSYAFSKCSLGWRIWERQADDYELTYIIKGKARYTVNNVPHELESGDLLCLTEGDIVEAVTYPQNLMHAYTVSFTPRYIAGPRYLVGKKISAHGEGELFPMVSRVGIRRDVIGMFRELTLVWNEQPRAYMMKSSALLMLILHRLLEIVNDDADSIHGDNRINRVMRHISAHYGEKITVKALARQVDMNEAYLGWLFKRETGMTIHQYMAKVRIENAEKMLQSGGYKVEKVAELCGYSDYFHFFKLFKAQRGFPPSLCLPRK